MIVEFTVECLGHSVGGHQNYFEIEIDDNKLEGMTEDEKIQYIDKVCWDYVNETIEIGFEIK